MTDDRTQILTAANIVTMTGDRPEALATRGEWIVATGDLVDLRAQFADAQLHDFGTATIVPGFNDAHQHPTVAAEQALQVDLSPERIASTAELQDALRARAGETPAGEWIVGFGYDPFRSNAGVDLTRDDLDAVGSDHPILVVHVTLHSGVVNTRGLELAGLHTATDAPSGGELGIDGAGRLNGVLHDQSLYDLAFPAFTRRKTVVPPPSTANLQHALESFLGRLNAAGITSVGDALVGPPGWQLLRSVADEGRLTVRVNALAAYEHLDYFRGLDSTPVSAESRLRIGGAKAFADGAVNGGTCLLEEPAVGRTGHGIARVSRAELDAIVRDVHDAGWRVCVHANGDRAIRFVLDSIEQAQRGNPRADVRHRIEHTSVLNPGLVARMRELAVVAVPFANYALAHGDKLRAFYGPERVEWMFAHRALLDAGVPVAGSSDYPCGPFEPLFAMQSCVARQDRTGAAFGASQRISAKEALGLYTTGAAYASGEEATKGRLAPGYLADLTVLGENPLAVNPTELAAVPVLETWVGGTPVWTGHSGR